MNFTKIICTIGPSTDSEEKLTSLMESGMNIARLNFSHGTHEYHKSLIDRIKKVSKKVGKPISILQDLCGPKMRIGQVEAPGIRLEPGDDFILTSKEILGKDKMVSVTYKDLPEDVKQGEIILLADGLLSVKVIEKTATEIKCKVINGGTLTSGKGLNLPSGTLKAPSLTEKDKKDLLFGLENGVDLVALSFVRTREDILNIHSLMESYGKSVPVVAKIEKHEAVKNIDEIIDVSDCIMVARGDLGVEIPISFVPSVQKKIVRKANLKGTPVIIATQMLVSMTMSPRPTRAEATDVANAVLDGADAVMLSEETASGKFPVEAVCNMSEIIHETEKIYPYDRIRPSQAVGGVPQSVSKAACTLSDELNCHAIAAPTRSGFTASQISKFRPKCPIIAFTPDERVIKKLNMYWGVFPYEFPEVSDTDEMINLVAEKSMETGLVKKGDRIVITAGHPLWISKTTNVVQIRDL